MMIMVDNWIEWNTSRYLELPKELREKAVNALRDLWDDNPGAAKSITDEIAKDLQTWWAPAHMMWGMGVRNFLRKYVKDDELPSKNWDDYYVPVVEVAVREGIYHLIPEEDRV